MLNKFQSFLLECLVGLIWGHWGGSFQSYSWFYRLINFPKTFGLYFHYKMVKSYIFLLCHSITIQAIRPKFSFSVNCALNSRPPSLFAKRVLWCFGFTKWLYGFLSKYCIRSRATIAHCNSYTSLYSKRKH